MTKGRVPYGLSNFRLLKEENYVYVDKTHYLEQLENLSERFLIYLRPRRFGKSLFTSVLYNYYDCKNSENFESIFGDTYVGKNKTAKANSYYVLQFDFSGMSSDSLEELTTSFYFRTRGPIMRFINYYGLGIELDKDAKTATDVLSDFLDKAQQVIDDGKIYIIIDEYDHFANNFLHNRDLFMEITGKGGFVRSWYEVVKDHTRTVVGRMFITGVSPITLDSLTSGFNIITNITRDLQFHGMMGFDLGEVENLIDTLKIDDKANAIDVMRDNYNGYLFNPKSQMKIFNSNLVLYFLKNYERYNEPPEEIIDSNIRSDYRRLSAMFDLFEDMQKKEEIITEIVAGNAVSTELMSIFELGFKFDERHFLSLLYYLGLLTFDKTHFRNRVMLRVPNLVIQDVYTHYYFNYLSDKHKFSFDISRIQVAIEKLALDNNIEPLVKLIETTITEMSNRNAMDFNEHNLRQLAWLYTNISGAYRVKDEYHTGNRYADLMLFSQDVGVSNVLIEFKYLTKDEYSTNNGKSKVEKLKLEAIEQINDYASTEEMKNIADLKKYIVIFAFSECVYFAEIE